MQSEIPAHDEPRHPAGHGIGGADDSEPFLLEHSPGPDERHGGVQATHRVHRLGFDYRCCA
ncbi:hypothetical protein [Paeniglutamicibacter antarcticus]|uniref:hypothetical protein n=1 Tax=Paeniglutamicibacter antarcticus TaxID=494023 RepID=UPI0031E6512A